MLPLVCTTPACAHLDVWPVLCTTLSCAAQAWHGVTGDEHCVTTDAPQQGALLHTWRDPCTALSCAARAWESMIDQLHVATLGTRTFPHVAGLIHLPRSALLLPAKLQGWSCLHGVPGLPQAGLQCCSLRFLCNAHLVSSCKERPQVNSAREVVED